ncbi:MAG: pyridine nucleotide-disulfide oxidoreductase [Desulfuromonas sp.]|nr:MAG: pyridine nucleotide-disulfide oxidoreductase [Desulfuromonas sp.]
MGRHLLLVGGGHAHLHTLSQARAILRRGHRITLINPQPLHYYSGMAPGLLGGRYRSEDLCFPLDKMAEQAGVETIWERVERIDSQKRSLILSSRRCVDYDVASFNVGSEVVADIPATLKQRVLTVKPVERLAELRSKIEAWPSGRPCRLLVVGGGAAGVELAGNLRRLLECNGVDGRVALVSSGELLPGWPTALVVKVKEYFRRRSVQVLENTHVKGFEEAYIEFSDGQRWTYDFALLATGVSPPQLFRESALSVGPDGGLSINPFLQSVDDAYLFAAGDCAYFMSSPLAKAGVYAVRQGPVLTHNLIAALERRPLSTYSPQQSFMQVLNLGDGRAALKRPPFSLFGVLPWRIKDHIDRSFMARYRAE